MGIKNIAILLLCAAALCGCAKTADSVSENGGIGEAEEFTKSVEAMDTAMTLKAYGQNGEKALDAAAEEIQRLDGLWRRGSESSEVYKINSEGSAEVSADTAELVAAAIDVCRSTGGVFDITIAPVMDLWGFYTKDFYVPSNDELANILAKVDYNNVSVDGGRVYVSNGSKMDLGGIAKGYLSSRIIDIFKENGVESGIISLGGNVQTLGKKPNGSEWRVAIQNPDNDETYIGSLTVSDKAVITSGGYQRNFEQDGVIYHHIIDPATGYPAESGLTSVTVISDNGTLADGLSTSLYIMGLDKGIEYWKTHTGFDMIFVSDENKIYITDGIAEVFSSDFEYSVINK